MVGQTVKPENKKYKNTATFSGSFSGGSVKSTTPAKTPGFSGGSGTGGGAKTVTPPVNPGFSGGSGEGTYTTPGGETITVKNTPTPESARIEREKMLRESSVLTQKQSNELAVVRQQEANRLSNTREIAIDKEAVNRINADFKKAGINNAKDYFDTVNGKKKTFDYANYGRNIERVEISPGVASKLRGQSVNPESQYFVDVETSKPSSESVDYGLMADNEAKKNFETQKRNKRLNLSNTLIDYGKASLNKGLSSNNPFTKINYLGQSAGAFAGAIIGETVNQELFQKIQFGKKGDFGEKGNIYVSPDLLILGGVGITTTKPTPLKTVSRPLSVAEKTKVMGEFESYLKEQGIKKGAIITREDSLKIQKFFLDYNRNNQNTGLVLKGESRLTRSKGAKIFKNEISAELKLSSIDELRIISETKNYPGVSFQNSYAVFKKGKAELVKPADLQKFDYIYLEGKSKVTINPRPKIKSDSYNFKYIEQGTKSLPGGNLGSLTESKPFLFFEKKVKDFTTVKRFNEFYNLKGAKVETNDFFAKIDSLDFSGAKVFRKKAVFSNDLTTSGLTREETIVSVRGQSIGKDQGGAFKSLYKQISKKTAPKEPLDAIDDMRFWIESIDKKMLVARNVKSVVEYESRVEVKIYSYDDIARIHREFVVSIPKKNPTPIFKPIITLEAINKGQSKASSGIFSSNADGTIQELRQEAKAETQTTSVSVGKTKTKSKSRSESRSQFSGGQTISDNNYKVFVQSVANENIPGVMFSDIKTDIATKNVGQTAFKPILFSLGKNRQDSDIMGKFAQAQSQGSQVQGQTQGLSLGQVQSQGLGSIFSQGQVQSQGLSLGQVQGQSQVTQSLFKNSLTQLRQESKQDEKERKKKRIKLPKFNNNKSNLVSGFDVYVKKLGEYRRVNSNPLSRSGAINFGSKVVDFSSSASFKILPSRSSASSSGEKTSNLFSKKFYKKNTSFIEKPFARIDSPGELAEITYKGIMSQKIRRKIYGA
jgi:hypothetical protein